MNKPRLPEKLGLTVTTDWNRQSFQAILPAPEMQDWVLDNLLKVGGPVYNEQHEHLREHLANGEIGFLWATPQYIKNGRNVLGQTEQLAFRSGGWQKARQEQLFTDWFGPVLPSWVITLSAPYCQAVGVLGVCALVDHELYHISQAIDAFGAPKFNRDTGLPVLAMRGHDVEQFNAIIKRYGMTSQEEAELVAYASAGPLIEEFML